MPYCKKSVSYLLLFFFCFSNRIAFAEDPALKPSVPVIAASSYLLQDFHTGKVLAESNADAKLAPASLTKILTVYVAFKEIKNGRLHLDDLATISENAWKTGGSKMFVQVNDKVKIEDLLKGIIIQSGNDASVAVAEHIAGNEASFAELMNQHAARLGMTNSHFENSDGLPSDGHYTTARDLAKLTTALIKDFPDYYPWFSQKEFTYNKITQHNRNLLLGRDSSVDGVKTGHTDEAGYCLVASALRNGMRLISVVMGTESEAARANENQNLLNYGFRFYESHKLYDGQKPISEARIYKGASETLQIGVGEDFYATIPANSQQDIKTTVNTDKLIVAPIKAGDKVGTVSVSLKGEVIATKDLVALNSVDKGNIMRRLFDSILLIFRKGDGS